MPRLRTSTIGPKRTTADALGDAELRSGKSGRSGRVVSLSDIERLTGYDRGTITRWIAKGLPVEGKGAKGAVLVDLRTLIEWREEQARADERKKVAASGDDSGGSVEDLDAQLKREQILFQKIKTAERVGISVPASAVLMVHTMMLNALRTTIDGIADSVARDLVGFPKEIVRQARDTMRFMHRVALKQAQAQMDQDFRRLTKERLIAVGADVDDDEDDFDPDAVDEEDEEADLEPFDAE